MQMQLWLINFTKEADLMNREDVIKGLKEGDFGRMTSRELDAMLVRTGHEQKIRKMALDLKLARPEEIAIMTSLDVCKMILKAGYEVLDPGEEGFFLIKAEDIPEVMKKIWAISR